jgi:hypothetical protein
MITPAISVLSAAEGLKVATPALADYVVPLIGHFILQSWGSARIGAYFGPVMALWFTALAVAGLLRNMLAPLARLELADKGARQLRSTSCASIPSRRARSPALRSGDL